jgi:hypothetical protein
MSKTIRIRTTPNGGDNFIKINMEQDFDFVEVLSLKIAQKDLYQTFCADYGAVVGRVIVNNGFGVPNAKISIFIPVSDLDADNDEIFALYPYETVTDIGPNGLRYNLLPSTNETNDDCFTPIGDFPKKRTFLDDDRMLEIYCKYYKFSTTTNQSGDYMIFGVPVGAHTMYVEADLSDVGIVSQKPYDLIRKGSSVESFDSTTKFARASDNIDTNIQAVNRTPLSVNIQPYWGEKDTCNVVITRQDINLNTVVTPHAIFMGSIFGDNEEGTINLRCRPQPKLGKLDLQTAGSGTIEMIRETLDGTIERFDIAGGKLIDSDGTWAYQIPMNLEYLVTDELGDLVPTDDPNKGIPTRARVRFRIGMDNNASGISKRAKYLVPHNPRKHAQAVTQPQFIGTTPEFPYGEPVIDFEFGPNTSKASLADLTWNTVYSVKNYIRRYEKSFVSTLASERAFIGIKDVDSAGGDINPFPYNSLNIVVDPLFNFICGLVIILAVLVATINAFLISPINSIIEVLNSIFDIPYISCITLDCISEGNTSTYAPGCNNGSNGCNAAQSGQDNLIICVGSKPDNEFDDTFPPGDAGYTACVAASLLQSLDLLEFDFFNDWVNGTLYSPLFINRNRTANSQSDKDNFCEWSCGGFDGYTVEGVRSDGVNPDNPCRRAMVVKQICGEGVSDSALGCTNIPYNCTHPVIDPPPLFPDSVVQGLFATFIASTNVDLDPKKGGYGVIVKKDGEYYYTPYARMSDDYILATDIITLGSSVSCHWLGLPSIIRFLDETTYKIPPVIPISDYINDFNNDIENSVSGMDSESNKLDDSLFFNVNCFYTSTGPLQCNNIRRQCELGMGLDQIPPTADNTLDDKDLDIRIARNLFAWMNNYTLYVQNANPLIISNPLTINTDYGTYDSNGIGEGCGAMLGEDDYLTFKYDWKDPTDTGILCRTKTKTLNSFYFYFGLNKNKTALSKTIEKYFSPCPVQEQPAFTIISDATDVTLSGGTTIFGSITLTIIGGTEPYTVTITYPDGTSDEFPVTGNTITFDGLVEGSYPITVTDNSGLVSTTTVIVGGPVPLNCFVEGINITGFNSLGIPLEDGIINVSISGGIPPYTIYVTDAATSYNYFTEPSDGEFTAFNLPSGTYGVFVEDSTTPTPITCFNLIGISAPTGTTVTFNVFGEQCEGLCNGRIEITLDGEPPYDIILTRTDGDNILNTSQSNSTPNTSSVTITGRTSNTLSIVNLCEGDYELTVIDSSNAVTPPIEITVPPAPYTNSQLDLDNAFITIDPTNNNDFTLGTGVIVVCPLESPPPNEEYTYYLYRDDTSQALQTITSSNPCASFTNLDCNSGNNYWIVYRNHLGCRFPSNLNQRYEVVVNNTGC